jgi:uncharacterized C2H2 Zn-finger protein
MEREEIPPNDELDDMDMNGLRKMASSVGADPTGVDADGLRKTLGRLRDGAKLLRCPNPECGYEWAYTGDATHRAACPRCGTSVRIKRNAVTE